jgi:protein involved in polysaccharide export with SLBB domain
MTATPMNLPKWAFVGLLFCSCGGHQSEPQVAPTVMSSAGLGPGDTFEVRVYGETELTGMYNVAPDGSIDFPLVGRVSVEGKTPSEVSDELTAGLRAYMKQPQVSIRVEKFNSKKVFVFGKVRDPGTFPYEPGMSIIEAITLAGGFDQLANKDDAFVTRLVEGREQRLEVSIKNISEGNAPNFRLQPGDIVLVPESMF